MKAPNTLKSLAGGTFLSLALVAGAAQAQSTTMDSDMMMDPDEMAAELQQAIEANPELGEYGLDVNATDEGTVVVSGMIDDQGDYDELQRIITDMDGGDSIDNQIVRN